MNEDELNWLWDKVYRLGRESVYSPETIRCPEKESELDLNTVKNIDPEFKVGDRVKVRWEITQIPSYQYIYNYPAHIVSFNENGASEFNVMFTDGRVVSCPAEHLELVK